MAIENLITQSVTLGFYAAGLYIHLFASADVRRSVRSEWRKVRSKLRGTNQIAPTIVHSARSPLAIIVL